jgi:hypothetical protein
MHATCLDHLILLELVTQIFSEEYKLLSSSFCSFLLSAYRTTRRHNPEDHNPLLLLPLHPKIHK